MIFSILNVFKKFFLLVLLLVIYIIYMFSLLISLVFTGLFKLLGLVLSLYSAIKDGLYNLIERIKVYL